MAMVGRTSSPKLDGKELPNHALRFQPNSRMKNFIIISCATIFALFSGLHAGGSYLKSVAPDLWQSSWPANGFAIAAHAQREFKKTIIANKGLLPSKLSDKISKNAIRAFRSEPFASPSVQLIALSQDDEKQPSPKLALMQLAAQLSKRSSLTNMWLVNACGQTGDIVCVMENYDKTLRSNSNVRATLFPPMINVLRSTGKVEPFVNTMSKLPPWAGEFWLAVLKDDAALSNAARLRSDLHEQGVDSLASLDSALLYRLVASKKFENADQLFQTLSGFDRSMETELITNFNFSRAPKLQPFDWGLVSKGDYGANINMRTNQLEIDALSGAGDIVASQILKIKPGNYRLAGNIENFSGTKSPPISVSIVCAERGSASTVRIPVEKKSFDNQVVLGSSDCNYYFFNIIADRVDNEEGYDVALNNIGLKRIF